ncbi:hypothetical protein JVU11DRAFT_3124 [Chiua virens]|nr:hypothetical protein JVU11DRAFT_3124 [Chiua virens]
MRHRSHLSLGHTSERQTLFRLGNGWIHELRHAARLLFDAGVVKLSDEESTALVDAWEHHHQ